jgi:large subunit ribosomal protein L15
MKLNNLTKIVAKKKKRLGRGYASGRGGHTAGRGTKGQKARSKVKLGFEGGQLPLSRRLPKRGGFRSPHGKPASFNLSELASFRKGETVSPQKLIEKGMLKDIPRKGVKILGRGEGKALTFEGVALSDSAKSKVLKAGGKIKE